MKGGDTLAKFDGKEVKDYKRSRQYLYSHKAKGKVSIVANRNGKEIKKTVILEQIKEQYLMYDPVWMPSFKIAVCTGKAGDSRIYFTADLHFYHGYIIRLVNRPYHYIKEMNEALVEN